MTPDQAALAGFDGLTRLFPLPNLVLFPGVVQGLHIFEPRYRQMMADTLAADGLMTIVLLGPGWEDEYDNTPAVEPVGCLGRVVWHEALADGRFNLRLKGLSRVRLTEEVPTDRHYRTARADLLADVVIADLARLAALRRRLADAVAARYPQDGPARGQLDELFGSDAPLAHVCDVLAYALPLPLELKQTLLAEPHAHARAELMIRSMDVPARPDRPFPPRFSPN